MATIAELEVKVSKAAEKVEKIKKTIKNHETQLAKQEAAGSDTRWKQEDIRTAARKLRDAEVTLANWQTKLNTEIEKERFIDGHAPQIIKDFLEDWKKKAFDWYVEHYGKYIKLREKLKEAQEAAQLQYAMESPEYADMRDENGNLRVPLSWITSRYSKGMEAFLKEEKLDWKTIKAREINFAGSVVIRMFTMYDEVERLAWLDKELESDKKAKLIDLVVRINEVVGKVTDASGLRIGAKGTIDGIIVGEIGKAKIETVSAGGHTVQCYHFRTLVHKL